MMEHIAQGAEAVIFRDGGRVIKERIPKPYRLPEIDERLRTARTRKEAKVLQDLPVPGPKLLRVDSERKAIEMEYLDGPRLADVLEGRDYRRLGREMGTKLRRMHDRSLIHGDLTTSNMILLDEIYFIDFGLSFNSAKIEDKAVDLHLLRQALESKHYTIWEECFREVLAGYDDAAVIARLDEVEARGRNK
jgi:Kae1-associated kinase Bud32